MKKVLILSLVFIFISNFVKSQFYEAGQDPFSISWKQIKTKSYTLIFPSGFEENALKYASTLDTVYPVIGKYLLKNPKPVSVVFHTQSSLSNGFVVYAPKRVELYTIPPQDNYPQDWLEQLALHETRHVVQLDALNQGFTRIAYYLTGEQSVGAISGLVPRWFLEGDAVYSETMFSNAGRGRSASFSMPYRAMVLDKKKLFPYEKALLGSYKDFIPDIYQMGYPMVKMARDSFDKDIFGKSLRFTGRNPFLIFPFGHSIKSNSGLNNKLLYEFTYNRLKQEWIKEDTTGKYQQWLVKNRNDFPNYNFPVIIRDSELVVQKWSLSQTRRIITVDRNGKEKKLISTGTNSGERLSVKNSKITWSENKNDLRWQNRTYSEIMVYDFEKRKLKRLTKKTWYFSPCFSPDGTKIAAVEEIPQYKSSLVILDAASGDIIKKTDAPKDHHLQYPTWSDQGEIYCIAVGKQGKSIIKTGESGGWEEVIRPSYQNISSFCFADSLILFAGESNDINNLFSLNLNTSEVSQITYSRFGAFEPFIDTNNHQLYFSDYTSDGYRIASIRWPAKTYPQTNGYSNPSYNSVQGMDTTFHLLAETKDNKSYPIRSYSKLSHLFNIHSWAPVYFNYSVSDLSNPAVHPGLMILSQNLLGTMISSFGYSFESGYSHLHANISYKALYPVISWNIDAGGPIDRIGGSLSIPVNFSCNVQSTVNISLPLNLSRRNTVSALTPYMEWKYNRNAYFVKAENKYFQELNFINWGVSYYAYTRMATRDIYPKAGFSSFFKWQSTPFENKVFNNIYAFSFRVYLPGILQHQSLQLRYGYQYQSPLRYLYSSLLTFPSGYTTGRTENLHLLNIDYALPLLYPDIHAGPLFYLKRIRAGLFYDMAYNRYHVKSGIISDDFLRSLGTDFIADVHFLRIMFPFQVGARISYLPDDNKIITQAIFSVNLVY